MRIVNLMENTNHNPQLQCEHGLSLYVELPNHRLLFDTGASSAFAQNAALLGVDLALVDTAVLSHGHFDHGGGLGEFLRQNSVAPVYHQQSAFAFYCNRHHAYIGLDAGLSSHKQLVAVTGDHWIDSSLFLLNQVSGKILCPFSNQGLMMQRAEALTPDDFIHEQSLVLCRPEGNVLLSGCSHRGVINILEAYQAVFGALPAAFIGGLHLKQESPYHPEELDAIRQTGAYLRNLGIPIYTCHCTGLAAYDILKSQLGSQLAYFSTGEELRL